MKKLMLLSCLSFFILSCSSDDDNGGDTTNVMSDYLPTSSDTTWNYAFEYTDQGDYNSGDVNVYYDGTNTIEGTAYQVLQNTFPLIGSMTETLLTKNNNNEITIRPVFTIFDETADLGDLGFIKNNMSNGQLVDEGTAEIISEAMEIPANSSLSGTVTPLIYIDVKNYHVNKPESMAVNGATYNNLTHQRLEYEIRVVLDIAISSFGDQTFQHELIEKQQYGVTNVWLAKDVGIVKTNYDYSFENVEMDTTLSFGDFDVDLLEIAPNLSAFNSLLNIDGSSEINP